MTDKNLNEKKMQQKMENEAVKKRFQALPPIMRYVFHQVEFNRYKAEGTYSNLIGDLEKAWRLVQVLVKHPLTGPVQTYHYIRDIHKPKAPVVHMAHYALSIADEMTRRCCWIYDQKNGLDKLRLNHPAFVPGREKLKPWVFAFERKDISSAKAKESYLKWVRTTDLGKRYEFARKNYTYALSARLTDFGIDKTVVCPKKWFLHPQQTLANRQRES